MSSLIDPSGTIVITGFWRSGTTWLLESMASSLQAKSVFEPLHLNISSYRDTLRKSIREQPDSYLHLFMPYVEDAERRDAAKLRQYTLRALNSSIPGFWVRRGRTNEDNAWMKRAGRVFSRFRDAFRTRVVTKLVRGQLLISALQSWFDPIIIHLRRDPRAIVPSFDRSFSNWWHHLSLEEQLLETNDGRSSYFSTWTDEIKRIDEDGRVARLAAYWALTERFVQDVENSGLVSLSYERLCREGENYLCQRLNPFFEEAPVWTLQGDSATTFGNRRRSTLKKRIYGWKEEIEPQTIRKIEKVVRLFGMSESLYEK